MWNGLVGSPYQSLTDFSELYVYKFDDNFIGISSNKIGIGPTGAVVGVNTTIFAVIIHKCRNWRHS